MSSRHLYPIARGWSLWRTAALRSAGFPIRMVESLALPEPAAVETAEVRAASADAVDALLLDDAFRTALTWQNPDLIRNWVARYLAALAEGTRMPLDRRDRRETLIARYAQRYATKNDTIGFFGGVAWAELGDSPEALTVRGKGDTLHKSVRFEMEPIKALADTWRDDSRIRYHLPVRMDPSSSLDGAVLHRPRRSPKQLDAAHAAILGVLSAGDGAVVGKILDKARGSAEGVSDDALADALAALDEQGVVRIGFPIPICSAPEMALRRQVAQLPESDARTEMLGELDRVAEAREAVAEAAAPEELFERLERMTSLLTSVTGRTPVAPKTIGIGLRTGRGVLYLDTRRDLDVELGSEVLDMLREPLPLVLDTARWLAGEVGASAGRELQEHYRALRKRSEPVRLSDLQFAAAATLTGSSPGIRAVLEDFQLRWAELLPERESGERRLSCRDLRPLVTALFPKKPLRWAGARQHSPDLLLARLGGGRYRWVLGELHVALNTLESRVFPEQSDDPQALRAATAADMYSGRIVPVHPNSAVEVSPRTYPPSALDPAGLYRYWSYAFDDGHPSGAATVPAAGVHVVERDGELFGRPVGEGWEAPVLEFFGEFLTAVVVNLFKVRPPLRRAPRVAIDDLVILREQWRFAAEEIPAPSRRSDDFAYLELRRWLSEQGVPRHFFAKTPAEPKPFFVDLMTPLLLDNFVRAVRRSRAHVDLVEMLPGPDELWLRDGSDDLYTAEFRVVAVDGEEVPQVVRNS